MNEPVLGSLGKLSQREREAIYRDGVCHPTTTQQAEGLARVQWLKKQDDELPFRRVLDIGCHDGFMHRWLFKSYSCRIIIGVDLCEDSILHARGMAIEEIEDEGPVAIYHAAGWECIGVPFKFTEILLLELLEHFPHMENLELLRTMDERLHHGGRILISLPHPDGPYGVSNPDPHHINLMGAGKLEDLLDEAFDPTMGSYAVQVTPTYIYAVWTKM